MLESRNVDQMKSNVSCDFFCDNNSGGHHTFLNFSILFKLSAHITIKKCKSHER